MREIILSGTTLTFSVPEDKQVYELKHDGYDVETTFEYSVPSHQIWRLNGLMHRADGPAFVAYNGSWAKPLLEIWHFHNKIHRRDGPARLLYSAQGLLITEQWFLNGDKVPSFQELLSNFSHKSLESFVEALRADSGSSNRIYDSIVENVIQDETLRENLKAMKGNLLRI